jgi:prepilin-type N-terminal cleavage/methylation domain-containing protein
MIHRRRPLLVRARGGFTLVEMLVTVTIVAILAAMVFGAMTAAENTAKIAKTRATIVKLHRLIMARYESYKTRRIPIDMFLRADTNNPINPAMTPAEMAQVRLDAIREIMRMELPERASDVVNRPDGNAVAPFTTPGWSKISSNTSGRKVPPTSVYQAYYSYWQQQESQGRTWRDTTANTHTSAECLYLIITMACPGGREQFSESEIGDVDKDGWPEFIDGWGRPIYFFRWAPGFIRAYGADSALQSGDATRQHDPFDTQRMQANAYQLIPLIYSAGPDGVSDLMTSGNYSSVVLSSGRRDPYLLQSGRPGSENNQKLKHFDNIHNHQLDIR